MKRLLLASAALWAAALPAARLPSLDKLPIDSRRFTVKADRIVVDNVTKSAVLTGHVEAVSEPVKMTSDMATRDADGVMKLHDPTSITTCTNHPGICHWSLSGEVEYLDGKYVKGRNVWLELYEIPVLWLPYFYYPLDSESSLRFMPGYSNRWGAYLMTKAVYDIAGDATHQPDTWWLHGSTRFDLRYRNGVALGETLRWNLGDFGAGWFKFYYAWDENYGRYDFGGEPGSRRRHWENWGSEVHKDRFGLELSHRWDVTEQDVFRVKGSIFSDSYFRRDFERKGLFFLRNEWMGYEGNEVAWERNEGVVGVGVSASGPLNEFYGGVSSLPDVYLDIQPQPVFSWPVNFESENRFGYLERQPAEYGRKDRSNPFSYAPGYWAAYQAVRYDTYNRLTAPVKTFDALSVVPRLAFRSTGWSDAGTPDPEGWNRAGHTGEAFRSVLESGVTFSGRGKAWISDTWQHMTEPYLDVLAQKVWYSGLGTGDRPYVFDNIDSSRMWEDQFAGRARNLPYSYYGITPGWRNAFDKADEKGALSQVFEIDAYAAIQFNEADFWGGNKYHRIARDDSPNYGEHGVYVMPGARAKWNPAKDISLAARAEYDPDNDRLAFGDLAWTHTVSKDFSYYCDYSLRDFRWWDFSSTPYDPDQMRSDDSNWARFQYVKVGFTHQPLDWFAWSPFVRWDVRDSEVDKVGAWFDYLTDCLGFRLRVSYDNGYRIIDGYRYRDDWDVGFFVYLRALGPGVTDLFD